MAFLFTSLAGLSTILGSTLIFIKFKSQDRIINTSLSFAAGIMISVSIFDLIPESYNLLNDILFLKIIFILIGLNVGIIISMCIDKFIPSTNNLYRVGVISMIAIIMHNIPEGIATYLSTLSSVKLGLCLSLAIALHNIPEGITISLPIYYSTHSKLKAFIYTFISGISEIFGALIASIFLKSTVNSNLMAFLLSIISGIMIYISFYELIPEALSYKKYKTSFISFIVGFIVMLISHLLIN